MTLLSHNFKYQQLCCSPDIQYTLTTDIITYTLVSAFVARVCYPKYIWLLQEVLLENMFAKIYVFSELLCNIHEYYVFCLILFILIYVMIKNVWFW